MCLFITQHLDLRTDKGTEYITGWKLKVWFEWNLLPLHDTFISKLKWFGNKIGLHFNNTPLVIVRNHLTTKSVI